MLERSMNNTEPVILKCGRKGAGTAGMYIYIYNLIIHYVFILWLVVIDIKTFKTFPG